jgi:hypothetical protein
LIQAKHPKPRELTLTGLFWFSLLEGVVRRRFVTQSVTQGIPALERE